VITATGNWANDPDSRSAGQIVYLSYSSQDTRAAAKIRSKLDSVGITVLDQTQLKAGDPWREALQRMLEQSDRVVALVGDDEIGPFVSAEISAALAASKPTFVLRPASASPLQLPEEVRILITDTADPEPTVIAEILGSK
jgi:hypothetical protein